MFKITSELTAHMQKNFGVAADADEATVRKAVSEAIVEGKLELDTVKELTTAKATEAENKLADLISKSIAAGLAPVVERVKALEEKPAPATQPEGEKAHKPVVETKGGDGSSLGAKAYGTAAANGGDPDDAQKDFQVRVKSVVERFDDSRTAATWDKSGNELMSKMFAGRSITSHMNGAGVGVLDMPNDRSKAIAGAWFKHLVNKAYRSQGRSVPWQFKMTEQDDMLVKYAVHESKFVGPIQYHGGESAGYWCEGEKVADGYWQKTLLDDSTSGGLEAVPIEFDAAVILTPLLVGELFPLVDVTQVTRRRIEATKIGNPTIGWGTSEGTSVGLFDTDGYVSAFDNNIYPVTGAMEVGKDIQSDSPLALGNIIVSRYGEVFKQEMDNVIANGNGTDRPTGIFQTSGVSSIGATNGTSGPPTIGDYEALMFGVAKEFRQEAGNRFVFLSTDTSYKRARGIAVDTSNDARRIFGMNEMSYTLFDMPYRVNSSAGNSAQAAVCLNRYRLYRRAGLEVTVVTNDRESARKNTDLIVVRARFGGGLDHASAMAKHTNAQS